MPQLKSKFTENDSELARFARILALPVRVFIIRMIIENGNAIKKKDISSAPFELENILKHIAELKLIGVVKINKTKADTIYSIDIPLFNKMVSMFFSLFDHLNAISQPKPTVVKSISHIDYNKIQIETDDVAVLGFGAFIKKHRLALKMSQQQLSHKIDIDRAELSRIECDKKSPAPEKLILISKALYIDLDILTKEYYSSRIVNIVEESGFSDAILKNVLSRISYLLPAS